MNDEKQDHEHGDELEPEMMDDAEGDEFGGWLWRQCRRHAVTLMVGAALFCLGHDTASTTKTVIVGYRVIAYDHAVLKNIAIVPYEQGAPMVDACRLEEYGTRGSCDHIVLSDVEFHGNADGPGIGLKVR